MEDDFIEEDDNIFGEDEVFDYMMLDEMEKESEKKSESQKATGCLSSIFFIISTFGFLGIIVVIYFFKNL
jgi:hypothetical protein